MSAGAALDALGAGDWDTAHDLAAACSTAEAAWVHALLHRLEGDEGNAAYWYRRAGRPPFEGSEDEERAAIRAALGGDEVGTPSSGTPARALTPRGPAW